MDKAKSGNLKKLHLNIIGYAVLFFLAGTLLCYMCRITNQSMPAFLLPTEYTVEYSLGGGEWQFFEKDTKLSGFDGDVVLRLQFTDHIPGCISFYINHIGVAISVNGEQVFWSGRIEDYIPEMQCGSYWSGWLCDTVTLKDQIEIRLHNPHSYGNANAYNEFIDSLYFADRTILQNYLNQKSIIYQITGNCMIVVSIALLGMALGYLAQRVPFGSLLWSMGMMSLFMAGYILMDTNDIEFRSRLIIFNTCVRQYCIMFAALWFADCIRKTLTGREKKMAGYLSVVLGAVIGILLLLIFVNVISVYDSGLYWAAAQGVVSVGLLGLCILEYHKGTEADRVLLVSYMILLAALLLELVNGRMNFWAGGIVVKGIFVMIFVLHFARAVKYVAVNHQASLKARELEEELKSSRVVLAMSQIQPHFIYNALGAIRSLCVEDIQTAVEAIDRFSAYLRDSLETIDKKQCISFHKEMELVDNYLYLEQRRFENKIKVVKDIKAEDFMLPPMSVQPIVENAVRHGIRKKRTGGMITIKSFATEKEYMITVTDDGVGFDVSAAQNTGKVHVGLQNVEKRLQLMCKGMMEVVSIPGQGTTVTICIPKAVK